MSPAAVSSSPTARRGGCRRRRPCRPRHRVRRVRSRPARGVRLHGGSSWVGGAAACALPGHSIRPCPPRLAIEIGDAPEPWSALGFAVPPARDRARAGDADADGRRRRDPRLDARGRRRPARARRAADGMGAGGRRRRIPRTPTAPPGWTTSWSSRTTSSARRPRSPAWGSGCGGSGSRPSRPPARPSCAWATSSWRSSRASGRRRGARAFWALVAVVGDLDAAAERLGPRLGAARDAVQPGRRIATVRRDAGIGPALALMSPTWRVRIPRRPARRAASPEPGRPVASWTPCSTPAPSSPRRPAPWAPPRRAPSGRVRP